MANVRTLKQTFNGGEITPGLFGNVDQAKVQSGLALCRNFLPLPHGPAQNRAGFAFVNSTRINAPTRLIPFSFSSAQTFAVELGAGYFRFHSAGETLQVTAFPGLLLNDTFASGDLTDWSKLSGTCTFSGGQLLLSAGASVCQAVATTPGQRYSVGAQSDSVANTGALTIRVGSSAGGSDVFSNGALGGLPFSNGQNNSAYVNYFTATGTTSYVTILNGGSSSQLLLATDCRVFDQQTPVGWFSVVSYLAGTLVCDASLNVYVAVQAVPAGTALTNTGYWMALGASPTPYTVLNPYAAGDLFAVHYVQSGDIITLTHANYAPLQLERWGPLLWQLAGISFASSLGAPISVSATRTESAGSATPLYRTPLGYVVTSVDQYGLEESLPSAAVSVNADLTIAGDYVTVAWSAPASGPAPAFYNVYKSIGGGAFGYAGQVAASASMSLVDRNITPDWTQTPPLSDSALSSAGNYPAAVGYYEQRRVFAGTNNQPQNVWATQPGTESNLSYSVPSQDSDALRLRIAALKANAIEHVVTLWDLLLLTASTVWRVYSSNGDALTPSTVTIKAQSQVGANSVQPVVVNQAALYAASQGGHVRELSYQWQLQGYQDRDLCLLARHLFDGLSVVDLAFSRSLYPVAWAASSSGALLALMYIPEQEVVAWSQHTTFGFGSFESVCVVQEGNFDVLYAVVNRILNGVQNRTIERLDTRQFGANVSDAFFVDSGVTQTFETPQTIVSGLSWLAGATGGVLSYWQFLTSAAGWVTYSDAANPLNMSAGFTGWVAPGQNGAPPLYGAFRISFTGTADGVFRSSVYGLPQAVACSPGEVLEAQCYALAYRGGAQLYVSFYNASGFVSSVVVSGGVSTLNDSPVWPPSSLADFGHLWGFVTAPAGVTLAYVELKGCLNAGQSEADVYLALPFLRVASAGQSTPSAWPAAGMLSALLDGKPYTGLQIDQSGAVALPVAASTVTLGLPISAEIRTPPVALGGDGSLGQGRVKNVNKIWARVEEFCGCQAGPDDAHLVNVPAQAYQSDGVTPVPWSGEWRVNLLPGFGPDGQVSVVQNLPLPITVCDLSLEVSVGG